MSNETEGNNPKSKTITGKIRITGILIIIAVFYTAWQLQFESITFKPDAATNLPAMFGYLLLICIFVERSIEMFLSSFRGAGADKLDLKIKNLQENIKDLEGKMQFDDVAMKQLTEMKTNLRTTGDDRAHYRAESGYLALWIGLLIGLVVSLVGVRILGNIVEFDNMVDKQKGGFIAVDVLLTGSVLAGGSEAFNKIMKVYNSFMTKSAENNKG